jgi:hypothetical protein
VAEAVEELGIVEEAPQSAEGGEAGADEAAGEGAAPAEQPAE